MKSLGALLPLTARAPGSQAPGRESEKNFPVIEPPLYQFGGRGPGPREFRGPAGLAFGEDDALYILDSGNHRIQVATADGTPLRSLGSPGSKEGEFLFPSAIAFSPQGELYVGDTGTGRIQVLTPEGRPLRSWGGLRWPQGIALLGDRVYVTDRLTHELRIFSRQGRPLGVRGGPGGDRGQFQDPWGVTSDSAGFLYVADSGNHRIQKLDAEGRPVALWGDWGAQAGLLSYPAGIAAVSGRVAVADRGNHRIQVFSPEGTFLSQWGSAPIAPGDGLGRMHFPEGLAMSSSGGLIGMAEPFDNRIQVFPHRDIRKGRVANDLPWWDSLHARLHAIRLAPPPPDAGLQRSGALPAADLHAVYLFDISSPALGPLAAFGGYGRKLGELNGIAGVAVDPDRGRVWVGDPGNRRIVLYELTRDPQRPQIFGRSVRVIAGYALDRRFPKRDGSDPAGPLSPGPLALDAKGKLYLLDRARRRIVVFGDDLRLERTVPVPASTQGFAVGTRGELWVTDPARFQVQEIDPEGRPGRSIGRRDPEAPDGFLMPYGVAISPEGSLFVTDPLLDRVKRFDREGRFILSFGRSGSGPKELLSPRGIDFLPPGLLVIEDFANHRAQAFTPEGKWVGTYVAGGLSTPLGIR